MKRGFLLISTVGFAVEAKRLREDVQALDGNLKGWLECLSCQAAVPLGVAFLEGSGIVNVLVGAVNALCISEVVPGKICTGMQN